MPIEEVLKMVGQVRVIRWDRDFKIEYQFHGYFKDLRVDETGNAKEETGVRCKCLRSNVTYTIPVEKWLSMELVGA